MNIIRYPEKSEWSKLVERPHLDVSQLNETVAAVLADVKKRGDDAVKGYELKFDHVDLPSIVVTDEEMQEAETIVSQELCSTRNSASQERMFISRLKPCWHK